MKIKQYFGSIYLLVLTVFLILVVYSIFNTKLIFPITILNLFAFLGAWGFLFFSYKTNRMQSEIDKLQDQLEKLRRVGDVN